MKKFVSIALALVLTLSLTVVAFAAVDTTGSELTKNIVVTVETKDTHDNYAAVVTWDVTTALTYKAAGKTWNTETMKWDVAAGDAAEWAEEYDFEGTVAVANKSSKAITVSVASNNDAVEVAAPAEYAGTIAAATAGNAEANGTATTATWDITIDEAVTTAYTATITVTIQ